MAANLSPAEVKRRVSVLRRFKELLTQQRDRFASYIDVLEKQKDVIERGSDDDLIAHVELEEQIVSDIFAIQKVIDPLEDMYQTLFPQSTAGTFTANSNSPEFAEERELPGIKAALEGLKAEAIIRTDRNRQLLAERMNSLRQEMRQLRSHPYALHKSVYASEAPVLVDIRG
jgi:hypothetical protein